VPSCWLSLPASRRHLPHPVNAGFRLPAGRFGKLLA
jgi:hypothetical protein